MEYNNNLIHPIFKIFQKVPFDGIIDTGQLFKYLVITKII